MHLYLTGTKKGLGRNAIRECKGLADFIRNRVDSTINNKDLSGKYCFWLEIPEELHNRALNELNDGRLNPLEELVQHHIYRVVKDDVEKQILLEQSTNNPVIEALKEQIIELERQIEALKSENESLRVEGLFQIAVISSML